MKKKKLVGGFDNRGDEDLDHQRVDDEHSTKVRGRIMTVTMMMLVADEEPTCRITTFSHR